MRGTVVCGVTDDDEGRGALAVAAELSERLGLRLVLVHVADGNTPLDVGGKGSDSLATGAGRERAVRLLAHLAAEHVAGSAERRSAVGDPARLLGQIAAEEAADLIVVGSRARGRLRRGLESQLARRQGRVISAGPALTSLRWLAVVPSSGASSPSMPGCSARSPCCCC